MIFVHRFNYERVSSLIPNSLCPAPKVTLVITCDSLSSHQMYSCYSHSGRYNRFELSGGDMKRRKPTATKKRAASSKQPLGVRYAELLKLRQAIRSAQSQHRSQDERGRSS